MKAFKTIEVDGGVSYWAKLQDDMVVCVMVDKSVNGYGVLIAQQMLPEQELIEIHYSEWIDAHEKAMQHIQNAVTNLHGIMVHGK